MAYKFLHFSGEVAPQTTAGDFYAPLANEKVSLLRVVANCHSASSAIVRIVWNFNNAPEADKYLWTITGHGELAVPKEDSIGFAIDSNETHPPDGNRKFSLCCMNNELSTVFMSGWAKILVE